MKAIIVSETELNALLDRLELEQLRANGHYRNTNTSPEAMNEAHRVFHYQVTRWIQEVGGSGVRR